MIKSIQYVMTNRKGEVKTFRIRCQQNESDEVNLDLWRPDNLRGSAQVRFSYLLRQGFTLSNWHVIEAAAPSEHIPVFGPVKAHNTAIAQAREPLIEYMKKWFITWKLTLNRHEHKRCGCMELYEGSKNKFADLLRT